ncbi:MAG: hypothetical protein P1U85_13920 [Verrucomicrobiales bacterium]|nr:hypothetical protein [Verrucomicrobiales bacterium]
MPTTKKTAAGKKTKSFEETLWDTANTALRGSAELESEGTLQVVSEGRENLRGSVESSDWSGATEIPRPRDPQGERGGANQFQHIQLS